MRLKYAVEAFGDSGGDVEHEAMLEAWGALAEAFGLSCRDEEEEEEEYEDIKRRIGEAILALEGEVEEEEEAEGNAVGKAEEGNIVGKTEEDNTTEKTEEDNTAEKTEVPGGPSIKRKELSDAGQGWITNGPKRGMEIVVTVDLLGLWRLLVAGFVVVVLARWT